jgi:DNA-directed RNA polymerase III subunit RPC7
MRDGPLYTILEPSSFTDQEGKVNRKVGVDPFEGMPTYINRYKKPRRTLPDLSSMPYGIVIVRCEDAIANSHNL